jgi:hypothetical protein
MFQETKFSQRQYSGFGGSGEAITESGEIALDRQRR